MSGQIEFSFSVNALRCLLGAVLLALPAASSTSLAQSLRHCMSEQHRQFDFWIGHWDVHGPAGKRVGTNRIEPIHGGCALLEQWTSSSATTGTSLNTYDHATGQWHQFWVDSSGGRLSLAGGFSKGKMVLTGESAVAGKPGQTTKQRISWELRNDGTVAQRWESSEDGGGTWKIAFQGTYIKRER